MSRTKQNGLTAGNSQPVKRLTKYATDFIARCIKFSSGFYLEKGIDAGLCLTVVVVMLQAVLMAAWGVQ
jgi:hypothetical protein